MVGKVRRNRENFYIDLHWKGERHRLFTDRNGNPFYSERQADRILERINSEIDYEDFDPKNWLPKGYAVSLEDRLICTFFDTGCLWDEFGPKNPPPLIKAVCRAIEKPSA